MAIGGDEKRLATGGSDKRICIWDTSTMTHLKTFTQHRGPVMVRIFFTILISGPRLPFIHKSTIFDEFRSYA